MIADLCRPFRRAIGGVAAARRDSARYESQAVAATGGESGASPYRVIFEASQGMIWLVPEGDPSNPQDFTVGDVNPAAAEILRLVPKKVRGHRLSRLLNRHSRPVWMPYFQQAWKRGEQISCEIPVGDSYDVLPVQWISLSLRRVEGGLLAMLRDISSCKHGQRRLVEAELQVEQTQRVAHVGSWSCELEPRRGWWSAETYRILGVDPTDVPLTYETYASFIHPDDRARVANEMEAAFAAGMPLDCEYRIRRCDGDERIVRMYSEPIMDDAGHPSEYVGTIQDLTEQRLQERHIRASESLRRRIVNSVPLVLFAIDLDGTIHFAEGMGLARQGFVPGETIGKSVFDLYREYPHFLQEVRRALGGESRITVDETRGATFRRWLEPEFDETGRVTGLVGISLDITEQHRAEAKVFESRTLLRAVVDSLPHSLFLKDTSGRYLVVNRFLAHRLGYEPEDMIGKRPADLIPANPDRIRAHDRRLAQVAGTKRPLITRNLDIDLPGSPGLKVEEHLAPVLDRDGNVSGVVGIIQDTTEWQRVQGELENHRAMLQAILDTLPARLIVTDESGRIVAVNDVHAKSVGMSGEEILGQGHSGTALTGEQRAQSWEEVCEVLASGVSYNHERTRTGPDGHVIHERIIRAPLRSLQGTVSGVLNVIFDITQQVETESQLRQAQKMDALGKLAGGVAHDFNNLLQVMIGYCELALNHVGLPEPMRKLLLPIDTATQRARDLTRRLLAFSRRSEPQRENVDLTRLLVDLSAMLDRLLGAQIEVEIRAGDEPVWALADRSGIEQAVMNLCVNARDAMAQGGRLTLSADVQALDEAFCRARGLKGAARYAVISVADTGTGIPAEYLPRIFEPFFTTKGEGHGTGLGLPIVYGIVKQHGGTVTVRNNVGAGTTFSIYLPLGADTGARVVNATPDPIPGGTETILIAEDDEHVRALLEALLTSRGYRVRTAKDGQEAIEFFDAHGRDIGLVIADVVMPGRSGRDLVRRIRASGCSPAILLLTGYSLRSDEEAFCRDHGVTLIEKPYSASQLFKTVRHLLDEAAHGTAKPNNRG